jgi:hypothetical protein
MSNALRDMRAAGIPVNWDVVRVGWTGPGTLGRQLTVDDIRTFADDAIIEARGAEAAAIATLSTATSEHEVMENLEHLGSLSLEGERAWRVFLLGRLLEALPASPVDALAELTSFWSAFGFPSESPHIVQGRGNTISPAEYYTRDMKDRMVSAHRAWVAQELTALRGK